MAVRQRDNNWEVVLALDENPHYFTCDSKEKAEALDRVGEVYVRLSYGKPVAKGELKDAIQAWRSQGYTSGNFLMRSLEHELDRLER